MGEFSPLLLKISFQIFYIMNDLYSCPSLPHPTLFECEEFVGDEDEGNYEEQP
jgi:hypothetical protein